MGLMKSIWAVAAVCTLTACGNSTTEPSVVSGLMGTAQARITGKQAKPAAPTPITRASLANVKGPVFLGEVPSRKARGTLVRASVNQGVETFVSRDNLSFAIRDGGIIIGTRGFGDDLMAADSSGLMSALVRGNGSVTRKMKLFASEGQLQTFTYTCTVSRDAQEDIEILGRSHSTTRVRETCLGGALGEFSNVYWMEAGQIRQSGQWIGPDVGHIVLQKVR